MATQKLNINLTKPISVESQMALVEYARRHRTQMCDAINEWLSEKRTLCDGDEQKEWWYEDDAHAMKGILFADEANAQYLTYCLDTIVRDWFYGIAQDVYESEEKSDEPELKTYTIHYRLIGSVEIEAESEDIARELFYDEELAQTVWDSVLENELVIIDSYEVTA